MLVREGLTCVCFRIMLLSYTSRLVRDNMFKHILVLYNVQCTYLCVVSTKVEQNRDVIPSEGVHKHVIQNWLVLYKGDRVQTYGVCPRSVPNNPGGLMSTMLQC